MIKLLKLNKFFNKGKQNEIHVINNTTLEFPSQGLISLLGESGCGKTTLLNVIGGLDKASGTIIFKDQEMKSYNAGIWDRIRANNIGYIFQNYYLLEDRTIYDNIKIVLNMIGINDAEEIDFRIKYVLESVGMYRFRNKLASDLSGGQKQRVAIARAIVKNPDVIIADEPTGNLDSNNSIEVLKIIKEISKEKLVILVTHNQNLAAHYSDRIIKIVDGKIENDQENRGAEEKLDYVDHNIYLKDLNAVSSNNINIYSNEDLVNLNLTLVKINNNYYLKTDEKNITVRVLRENSEIKFIDDHKENVAEVFTSETSFDLETLESFKRERHKRSIYSFKDSLIAAFKKLANLGRKGKIQIIALIYLGLMFTTSFLLFASSVFMDTSQIMVDKNIYRLDYDAAEPKLSDLPEETIIYNNYGLGFYLISGTLRTNNISGINFLPKEAIGKESTPVDEVFIDESVLDKKFANQYLFTSFGITEKRHLINQKIRFNNFEETFKIVETVNRNSRSIYIDKSFLEATVFNFLNGRAHYYDETLVLNDTLIPPISSTGIYDIYISEKMFGDEAEFTSYGMHDFRVVGYFIDDSEYEVNYNYYAKRQDIREFILKHYSYDLLFYTENSQAVEGLLRSEYDYQLADLKSTKLISLATSISQSLIALGISVLIFYFLVRSSLTSRRKEITVLRSLGISKGEIRRLFVIEYFILTTATSLIGFIIGSYIADQVFNSALSGLLNIRTNPLFSVMTIGLIYFFNIIVSLIPINQMLRKTPATLLTNYDI